MAADASAIAATLSEHLSSAPGKHIYGVVDAARCVDLAYEAQIYYGVQIRSLFLPDIQPRLWNVAPYLVPIDPVAGYLDNWARRWGESAGILLVTDAGADALHEHLRKIFVVLDEQQQEFFFRFYDPRVLSTVLPTCSVAQLDDFFGPVASFAAECEGGNALLTFRRTSGKLVQEKLPVLVG